MCTLISVVKCNQTAKGAQTPMAQLDLPWSIEPQQVSLLLAIWIHICLMVKAGLSYFTFKMHVCAIIRIVHC